MQQQTQRQLLWLGVALGLAAGVYLGAARIRRFSHGTSGDAKREIFVYLFKQTGQRDFKPPFDFDLHDQVALLRSNANILEQRSREIRSAMQRSDAEAEARQAKLEPIRAEVRSLKQAAGTAKARLTAAESLPQPDPKELAGLRAECDRAQQAWSAKRADVDAAEAQLAGKDGNANPFGPQLAEADRVSHEVRKALNEKAGELSRQENVFIRSGRQRAGEAGSYRAIYILIGEQLSAADRLLSSTNVEQRRIGLGFAREACGHAGDPAQNPWLAARISEAFLWPHLDRADYTPSSRERAQDLLKLCQSAFNSAGELDRVSKNYELMILHAPNRHHADTSRLNLAELLEQQGDDASASRWLKQIEETNLLAMATQRLARIQQRQPALR